MPSDEQIEKEIQAKGLNAPRVTIERINSKIRDVDYLVWPGTTMTLCLLTLVNGFSVLGKSAAASPENFDEEIGKKVARQDAINQMWPLEGYLLKEELLNGRAHIGQSKTIADIEDRLGRRHAEAADERAALEDEVQSKAQDLQSNQGFPPRS